MPRGVRDKLVRLTRVCVKCVKYWYRFFKVYARAFENQVLAPVCFVILFYIQRSPPIDYGIGASRATTQLALSTAVLPGDKPPLAQSIVLASF